MDNEILEQNLKCPICLTVADDPWESGCCGHIFCNKCIKGIKHLSCPICRSNKVNFRENTFVKMLMNNLQTKCPYGCEKILVISNNKTHRYECELAVFRCSIILQNGSKCKFEGTRVETLKHFTESHTVQMTILSENYASMKNTFDKHPTFDKINKVFKKKQEEKAQEIKIDNKSKIKEIIEEVKYGIDNSEGSTNITMNNISGNKISINSISSFPNNVTNDNNLINIDKNFSFNTSSGNIINNNSSISNNFNNNINLFNTNISFNTNNNLNSNIGTSINTNYKFSLGKNASSRIRIPPLSTENAVKVNSIITPKLSGSNINKNNNQGNQGNDNL